MARLRYEVRDGQLILEDSSRGARLLVPLPEVHKHLRWQRQEFRLRRVTLTVLDKNGRKFMQLSPAEATELRDALVKAYFAEEQAIQCQHVGFVRKTPCTIRLRADHAIVHSERGQRCLELPEIAGIIIVTKERLRGGRLYIPNVGRFAWGEDRRTCFWLKEYIAHARRASLVPPRRVWSFTLAPWGGLLGILVGQLVDWILSRRTGSSRNP